MTGDDARKVPHCAIRAKERYGIDLTWNDVEDISRRCAKGEGRTETNADGSQFHLIVFGQVVLWIVYRPSSISRKRDGVVTTVMPPEVARKRIARDAMHMSRRQGFFEKKRRSWR